MHVRRSISFFVALTLAALISPLAIHHLNAQANPRQNNGLRVGQTGDPYNLGYREGERQGEQDARRGRGFDLDRDPVYRDGDRGYNRRSGTRDMYRDRFRDGFASGYRAAYERIRGVASGLSRKPPSYGPSGPGVFSRQLPRSYQEPAFARGYADGYEQGLRDGRDRDRYDPVGSRDYREGDQGYYDRYGSRDAYKNNYRAGFRQGYDDGYRDR